jgi:NADPH:quinone reductase-like Zn-dependent oxidoreductase/SAM-dependent methyltransferase
VAARSAGKTVHPLLGSRLRSALPDKQYESLLSAEHPGFLRDHRVAGRVVFPGTGYVELAVAAAVHSMGLRQVSLTELEFQEPLFLESDADRTVQVITSRRAAGETDIRVLSLQAGGNGADDSAEWVSHAACRVEARESAAVPEPLDLDSAVERCGDEIAGADFYELLRGAGMEFGPAFRGVNRAWRGQREVLGEIGDVGVSAPESAGRQYFLHPAIMDACLQLSALVADDFAEKESSEQGVLVPAGVARFTLLQSNASVRWSHVRERTGSDNDQLIVDVTILDAGRAPVATLEGLRLRRLSRDTLRRIWGRDDRGITYEVEWHRSDGLPVGSAESPSFATEFKHLRDEVVPWAQQLAGEAKLARFDEFVPELEELATAYVIDALRDLGWGLTVGSEATVDSLMDDLSIAEQHRRLLCRFLDILAEDGALQVSGDSWKVLRAPESRRPADLWSGLIEKWPEAEVDLVTAEKIGSNLASGLMGRIDPLDLLFPSGSLDAARRLYSESSLFRVHNEVIGEAIRASWRWSAAARRLRIIEIGAGTGGTTSSILSALPEGEYEYVFTDASALFTKAAMAEFGGRSHFRCELLDVERDPTEQGFEPGSFDIVVAANVLHATADLRQSVKHVRGLLRPKGLLVLLEGTGKWRFADLVVGLTDGWWRFSDPDLRKQYALIAPDEWRGLLSAEGFSDAFVVNEGEGSGETMRRQAVVVAQAGDHKVGDVRRATTGLGKCLVFADDGGLGELLVQQLDDAVLVRRGSRQLATEESAASIDPEQPADFDWLLEQAARRGEAVRHVIYLWALDGISSEEWTAEQIEHAEALVCGGALHLAQSLVRLNGGNLPSLTMVTRGAQAVGVGEKYCAFIQAPLWGFGNSLRLEHSDLRCRLVDLDPLDDASDPTALIAELSRPDNEARVAYRGGVRFVARLAQVEVPQVGRSSAAPLHSVRRLQPRTWGQLEGLGYVPASRTAPGPSEVEIQVAATGLTFRDVLRTLGEYPGDQSLGTECSGTVVAVGEEVRGLKLGSEVIAVAPGAFATHVTTPAALAVPKPENISFVAAAAIPSSFLTALYSLGEVAQLAAGESVLIHAAAGGVGLAAVQVAQRLGAKVFATAGNPAKRAYLLSLGVDRVMDSRSTGFQGEIMESTGGAGVDVVLNSLSGESIAKSFDSLAPGGRFVEIGRRGIWSEAEAKSYRSDVIYRVVNLAASSENDPSGIGRLLGQIVEQFENGDLTCLPFRVFAESDVERAFSFMARARQMGKIVVVPADTGRAGAANEGVVSFRPDASYLITGGLGGLGLRAAAWIVQRGGRHVILMGRSKPSAGKGIDRRAQSRGSRGSRSVRRRCRVRGCGSGPAPEERRAPTRSWCDTRCGNRRRRSYPRSDLGPVRSRDGPEGVWDVEPPPRHLQHAARLLRSLLVRGLGARIGRTGEPCGSDRLPRRLRTRPIWLGVCGLERGLGPVVRDRCCDERGAHESA